MLTGKRLFEGSSLSRTLAEWSRDRLIQPPREQLSRMHGAAAREHEDRETKTRLRDIGEARIVLDRVIAGDPPTPRAQPPQPVGPARRWTPWAVAVLAWAARAGCRR
jgi:hypothetical protein